MGLLLVGLPLWAQEVRVNQYWASYEEGVRAAAAGSTVRVVWATVGEFCPTGEAVMRAVDVGGSFTTPDTATAADPCSTGDPLDIAILPSGVFLVVSHKGDSDGAGINGRVFDSTGAPLTNDFTVNQVTAGWQDYPRVTAVGTDRYAVVWDEVGFPLSISGRVVMGDGSMPYPQQDLSTTPSDDAADVVPAGAAGGGGIVAVWGHARTASPLQPDVRARVFDDTFQPISPEVIVNQLPLAESQGSGSRPDIAAGVDGYLVTWDRGIQPSGNTCDVAARLFDPLMVPLSPELQVNTYTDYDQSSSFCGVDSAGRSVIVWQSGGQDGSGKGVYGRRFDATGAPLGEEFRINGTTYDSQGPGAVVVLPSGGFIPVWGSYQDQNYTTSVFMRRYFFPVSLALAPGRGPSNPPEVRVVQPDGLATQATIPAYGTSGYGANVGAGNVDGSTTDEVLTGPGPSPVFGPQVHAFRSTGTAIAKINFYAYGTLRYGVRAAGGSIDGDAYAEILTAPGEGVVFGPHIRAWDYDNVSLQPISKVSFFAYSTLRYGARVVGGDIDGDGVRELVTAPGPGPPFGPQVRAFNYDGVALSSIAKVNFNATPTNGYGCTVAAADVESDGIGGYGDGYQEIVAGKGPGGIAAFDSKFYAFDYDNAAVAAKCFMGAPYLFTYGANVAGGDVDAGDTEEIVTAPGPDPAADAHVLVWEWEAGIGIGYTGLSLLGTDDFVAFKTPAQLYYGANVAVGTFE